MNTKEYLELYDISGVSVHVNIDLDLGNLAYRYNLSDDDAEELEELVEDYIQEIVDEHEETAAGDLLMYLEKWLDYKNYHVHPEDAPGQLHLFDE